MGGKDPVTSAYNDNCGGIDYHAEPTSATINFPSLHDNSGSINAHCRIPPCTSLFTDETRTKKKLGKESITRQQGQHEAKAAAGRRRGYSLYA